MTIKENINHQVKNSIDMAKVMTDILDMEAEQDKTKEHFWIIGLNAKNYINYIELISLGSMTSSIVHPREVFKIAIMKNSASIIACHNHPSGHSEASTEDEDVTERLQKAGDILGIELLDHIIIGNGTYKSLMNK